MSTHWTFSNVVFSVFGLGGEALHGISRSTEDYILLQAGEVRGVNMNHYFFFFFLQEKKEVVRLHVKPDGWRH